MDRSEIRSRLQFKWTPGNTTNTIFNNAMNTAIDQAVQKICGRFNFWFLEGIGSLTTVAGQAAYKIGCPSPQTPCVATDSGAAGLPDGTYQYYVTYVNAWGESSPGPLSAAVVVVTNNIALTGIPTAPASQNVTARRIYRNTTLGASWYLVTTINNNTATTYTDTVSDAVLRLLTLMTFQHTVKPFTYAFQTSSPATIVMLQQQSFRSFVPSGTLTGPPEFAVVIGDEVTFYPTPDAAYTISVPYFFRWRRIFNDSDLLPEAIPESLVFDYAESEWAMMNNKENKFYTQAIEKFVSGLEQLVDDHIRNTAPLRILSEDEEEASWITQWIPDSYLRT